QARVPAAGGAPAESQGNVAAGDSHRPDRGGQRGGRNGLSKPAHRRDVRRQDRHRAGDEARPEAEARPHAAVVFLQRSRMVRVVRAGAGPGDRGGGPERARRLGRGRRGASGVEGGRGVLPEQAGRRGDGGQQRSGEQVMALMATEKKLDHLHWPLVLCTLIICSLGVWNLASATKNAPVVMALVQFRWMIVGAVAVGLLMFIDYRYLQTVAWPVYVGALGLLAGGAFAGKKVLGAPRRLQAGAFHLH